MAQQYLHEELYRGRTVLEQLGAVKIAVCGAGALGSLLVDQLVRQGVRHLTVVDRDRVETHNIGTQLYGQSDVGAFKVEALRAHCFRAVGVEIEALAKTLDVRSADKLLREAELVIDTFDNSRARQAVAEYCHEHAVSCLHLGLNTDYGEVHWNEGYRVPHDVLLADPCAYPLARNLIGLVVAVASEVIVRYVSAGRHENYALTLRDLKINLESP
jgi:tRNA A37 threonylcarbamoyladenosine dehydratase